MAKLVIQGKNGEMVSFPLIGPEVLIGRLDSVDLVLEDPKVSRVHAKVVKESDRDVIVDLESSTGTLVNGNQIARYELRDGDLIQIASEKLEYRE